MKTVIHLINNLRGGGAENLLTQIVNSLSENYHVVLLLLNDNDSIYREHLNSKIDIHILSKSSKYNPLLFLKINYYIKKYRPVALHAHLFPSFYYAALQFKYQFKKIYTEHSTSNKRRKFIPFNLEKFIYKRYDKIICISSGVSESLRKYLNHNLFNNRVSVINNGIILPLNPKPRRLLKKPIYHIGMIGRFEHPKDQITLIKSADFLKTNLVFHFFGDGKNLSNAKSEALKFKSQKFVFHGYVDDVNTQINELDLCVVSSLWEGFGLSALESMAIGVPTFGTNVDGLSQVIGCEKYLFEFGNSKQIAELIDECLTNNSFYEAASMHGILHSKNFNITDTFEAYHNLYI